MLRFIWVLAMVGCAASPKSSVTPAPGTVPAPLADADVVRMSHAFFKTVDQRDSAAFLSMLGGGFALFEDGRALSGDRLAKGWAKSKSKGARPRIRTCSKESVRRSEGVVVYVGDCKEKVPGFGKVKASDWQGWNTVVFARAAGTWKVAWWQWQKSGIAAERARWNDAYRKANAYTKQPNKLLVSSVATVTPGSALVVAMGQGRNALYLAGKGWRVTGVDISDEGIRVAKKQAAARKLSLTTVLADLNKYDFGRARWDLVTMLYAGNDLGWINKIKDALKPGGLFVVEYFYGKSGFTTGQLKNLFKGWDIVTDQVTRGIADWGRRETKLVRFVARKR